jgi:hypothetical protein
MLKPLAARLSRNIRIVGAASAPIGSSAAFDTTLAIGEGETWETYR